jgi:hypothetical protein
MFWPDIHSVGRSHVAEKSFPNFAKRRVQKTVFSFLDRNKIVSRIIAFLYVDCFTTQKLAVQPFFGR